MMVALYERPEIRVRNQNIMRAFRQGRLSRKQIAAQHEVTLSVVNNVIHKARAHANGAHARRKCSCGRRRR